MAKTVSLAVQRVIDESNRASQTYPSTGYSVACPGRLQVQDELDAPASTTTNVWTKLASDGVTDDWSLFYVESVNSQLTLQFTLLDAADANPRLVQMPLVPGVPFQSGSRLGWEINPDTTAYYVSQVDVIEELAVTTAKVSFTIARP